MTQLDLFVRSTDPSTSHDAAAAVAPANAEIVTAIRVHLFYNHRATAFQIADALAGERWGESTIRTAVSRAGLSEVGIASSPRGHRCMVYSL